MRVSLLPMQNIEEFGYRDGIGEFVIKNAKRELKWKIWKDGSNLETWFKLGKWQKWWFSK